MSAIKGIRNCQWDCHHSQGLFQWSWGWASTRVSMAASVIFLTWPTWHPAVILHMFCGPRPTNPAYLVQYFQGSNDDSHDRTWRIWDGVRTWWPAHLIVTYMYHDLLIFTSALSLTMTCSFIVSLIYHDQIPHPLPVLSLKFRPMWWHKDSAKKSNIIKPCYNA